MSTPRIYASTSEIIRGCSFASDFTDSTQEGYNDVTDTGTGNTIDSGLTTDGNGYLSYDVVSQPGSFSVVVRFSRASAIANILVDGDMEASGTSNYEAGGGTAILSKETNSPYTGIQWLKIEKGGGQSGAYQNILVNGASYIIAGAALGDGIKIPQTGGSFSTITLSNTTDWESFSNRITATGVYLWFGSVYGNDGNWCGFDNITVKPIELLASNANLIAGTAADGFSIWIDEDGVKANHSTSSVIPTECAVDLDYADGEVHTVTFTVDQSENRQRLLVDGLTADEQTIATTTETGTTNPIEIAGDGNDNFTGTVERVRIFDAVLTQADHNRYYAGNTVESSLSAYLIIPLLRAEIAERIEDLNPTGYKSRKFKERTKAAQRLKTIQEEQGKPRLFQLGDATLNNYNYVGSSTVDPVYMIPLEIVYPNRSDGWDDAIHDDIDCISRVLRTNNPCIDGVQHRWVDLEIAPIREPYSDDTWQIVTLQIRCILGVS